MYKETSVVLLMVALHYATAQQCSAGQFAVKNNGEEYLTINSATDVKTCGGINICDALNQGKQTLSLSAMGDLSVSNGNSVTLPDTSSTNEIQQLSIDGGAITLSNGGGSAALPDPSSTNELQQLSINGGTLTLSDNGGSVTLPDSSSTNEIQTLALDNGTLSLSSSNAVQLPLPWATTYTTQAGAFSTNDQFTLPLSNAFSLQATVTKTTNAFLLTTNLHVTSTQSLSWIAFRFVVRKGGANIVKNMPFYNVEAAWSSYYVHGSLVITGLTPGTDYYFEVWGATNIPVTLNLLNGLDYTFTVTKIAD